MPLMDDIKRGWNAFRNKNPTEYQYDYGDSYYYRPDFSLPLEKRTRSGR